VARENIGGADCHEYLISIQRLKAMDLQLTAAEIEVLSAITVPAPQYPEWMIERQNEGRG
jgi:hypothetical protein